MYPFARAKVVVQCCGRGEEPFRIRSPCFRLGAPPFLCAARLRECPVEQVAQMRQNLAGRPRFLAGPESAEIRRCVAQWFGCAVGQGRNSVSNRQLRFLAGSVCRSGHRKNLLCSKLLSGGTRENRFAKIAVELEPAGTGRIMTTGPAEAKARVLADRDKLDLQGCDLYMRSSRSSSRTAPCQHSDCHRRGRHF